MPRQYTPRVECTCQFCGKAFTSPPKRVQQGRGKFCSRKCQGAASRAKAADRFWSRVDKDSDCWLWQGRIEPNGYGSCWYEGRTYSTHRVAYELTYGSIPAGIHILHHCDVRTCCNPAHLFMGTAADNMQDMKRKGRSARGVANGAYTKPHRHPRGARNGAYTKPERVPKGEKNGNAKLSTPAVIGIRNSIGLKQHDLAHHFNVSQATINNVILHKIWRHL